MSSRQSRNNTGRTSRNVATRQTTRGASLSRGRASSGAGATRIAAADPAIARPFFGQAAPAYEPAFEPEYESQVKVRTGGRQQVKPQPSLLTTAAKMLAVVIVVVAALSFARIMLTSVNVTTMIKSDQVSAQISELRSAGTSLEMEQSVLTSPSAIRAQAREMSMGEPVSVTTITLTPDVVSIENDKTLSLSGTIKNVVSVKQ